MLRRGGLLVVVTAFLTAGCSIDRVEWESTGFPVEEVRHALEEEHHAESPTVECIKREVAGALWECRAHDAEAEYECEVKVGPREAIRELECMREHEETGDNETAEQGQEAEAETQTETPAAEHETESTPAEEPSHAEDAPAEG